MPKHDSIIERSAKTGEKVEAALKEEPGSSAKSPKNCENRRITLNNRKTAEIKQQFLSGLE